MLGILGGTFDPIHVGHLLIAETARSALNLDRVLFVPAADPPHKQAFHKTPAAHRCRMVALAIGDNPGFELSTVDLDRPGPHYSVDTVRLLRQKFGLAADDCAFILGSDSLADLPAWHQPEALIQLCRLAAMHRPGFEPDVVGLERALPGLAARLDFVPSPLISLSASHIRATVAAGRSIRYQVPDVVIAYITQHGLYHAD